MTLLRSVEIILRTWVGGSNTKTVSTKHCHSDYRCEESKHLLGCQRPAELIIFSFGFVLPLKTGRTCSNNYGTDIVFPYIFVQLDVS